MKVAALNNRFSMQTNSPISEEGATWDDQGWRGESVPGFRGQANSPARGSCRELKSMVTSCSGSHRAFPNYVDGVCLCPVNGTTPG